MRQNPRAVHVATISKTAGDKTYETVLLRRSYREGDQVKHHTLGNLSDLPPDCIDYIRRRLAGEPPPAGDPQGEPWEIVRSLPHGHVAAVLGTLRHIGLEAILGSRRCRERDLAVALIVARIIAPASKLATLAGLQDETAQSTLGAELGLGPIGPRELYDAIDWLQARHVRIENKLAKKHLENGTLILYDVTSSYYTGRCSELVKYGYNRDGKKRFPQIVYGLLCHPDGCPVAVEVFAGNTADPNTLSAQVKKVRRRFGIEQIVFVGDRGMLTSKRIQSMQDIEGLDWITALRADTIRKLVREEVITPSQFDGCDLAEVTSPDFPGERLIACRNLKLAEERARKRRELLTATERDLDVVAAAVRRAKDPLRGKAAIGLRLGKILNQHKMAKHFELHIEDDCFSYQRRQERIAAEAQLDGIYVIRTSVPKEQMSAAASVGAYKTLSYVEHAFRSVKTVDLKVRPIYHWLSGRIRGHVLVCMLAYYVEWHMRKRLAPLLFDDHEREQAEASRPSIVAPAPRSKPAQRKDAHKRTADDLPVQSFQCLLKDLATLCRNRVRLGAGVEFDLLTTPTPLQTRAMALLDQPIRL